MGSDMAQPLQHDPAQSSGMFTLDTSQPRHQTCCALDLTYAAGGGLRIKCAATSRAVQQRSGKRSALEGYIIRNGRQISGPGLPTAPTEQRRTEGYQLD